MRVRLVWLSGFLLLAACETSSLRCGPGTAEVGRECVVVDAGPSDAARPDASRSDSGVVLGDGDTIVALEYPREVDVEVIPGSLSCLRVWALRADGHTELLALGEDGARVEIDDPTIAMAAPWDDCRGRTTADPLASTPGIIGLRAGTTRAHVIVEVGTTSLVADIGVTVQPYTLSIRAEVPASLPAGRTVGLTGAPQGLDGSMEAVLRSQPIPAPSLFRFEVGDPSLLEVVRDEENPHYGYGYSIRGRAVGDTTLTLRYGLDASQSEGPFDVSITDPGTLISISTILATLEPSATSTTGYCHRAHAVGTYQRAGEPDYVGDVSGGVTWESLDAGLVVEEPGDRALLCATRTGETRVRACVGAVCGEETLASFSAAVTELVATPNPVDAPAAPWASASVPITVCIPYTLELVLADGTRFDATLSPIARYVSFPGDGFALDQQRDAARMPQSTGGAPCFSLQSDLVCPTVTEDTIALGVSYPTALPPGSIGSSLELAVHVTSITRAPSCM